MAQLSGQTLLVTGAGGALALGVLPALRAVGATLVLADRKAPVDRLAQDEVALAADLIDPEGARRLWRQAEEASPTGSVNGVVHLVGGFVWGPAHESTDAQVTSMVGINLLTTVNIVRAALPDLRKRGSGFIAGIASGQAWHGGAADVALYAATKAAVAAYLRSVDAELADTDVAVSILFPMGVIDTSANRDAMPSADPSAWIDPHQLGEALAFAATRNRRGRVMELPVYPGRG